MNIKKNKLKKVSGSPGQSSCYFRVVFSAQIILSSILHKNLLYSQQNLFSGEKYV